MPKHKPLFDFGKIFCYAKIYLSLAWLIRISILILSIIYFVSEFKIFYILSIITFLILCIVMFFIIYSTKQNFQRTNCSIINKIICVSFYLFDAVSYFFFFYEEIYIWAIFALMIISDISFGLIFYFVMFIMYK